MSMTTHEAIERTEGELLAYVQCSHDNPTLLALAFAALAIAKALAEISDRYKAERRLRMTQ